MTNQLIKIELTALANNSNSFNGKIYGDGSVYIGGVKYFLSEYNISSNDFISQVENAKGEYYEKEMEFQDEYMDIFGKGSEKVQAELINYINSL